MAGKTRKQGSRPSTLKTKVEIPKGHLGLKSSPFAPTDCKLTSQFMVVDQMNAHYRKVTNAKCAIDNTPPKAWLVSQKVRDQARRAAMQSDLKRRDAWLTENKPRSRPASRQAPRPDSRASSDVDRDEMMAMMQSLEDYDEVDHAPPRHKAAAAGSNTTLEVQISDGGPADPDMALIDRLVADQHNSPSQYHSGKKVASNIPPAPSSSSRRTPRAGSARRADRPNSARRGDGQLGATTTLRNSLSTPRSGDPLDNNAHRFTEEKPFQPRINRTNRQSKLSEFKYYNPPKQRPAGGGGGGGTLGRTQTVRPESESKVTSAGGSGGGRGTRVIGSSGGATRPTTPLTESVDLLNASLMSRDLAGHARTPTGVPPLDISLDHDHMRWLQEQSKKAQLRSTYQVDGEAAAGEGGAPPDTRGSGGGGGAGLSGAPTRTLSHQAAVTGRISTGTESEIEKEEEQSEEYRTTRYPTSPTLYKVEQHEEELKYLEFITEVTNDVLDRGIFTNRVLKQVFHSHIQRRKHDLKVSRMRELLDELRQDLGIPSSEDDVDPGVGLTSTISRQHGPVKTLKFADDHHPEQLTGLDHDLNELSLNDGYASKKQEDSSEGLNGTLGGAFNPLMMTTKKFDMATLRQAASRSATQSRSRSPSPGTGRPPIPKRAAAGRATRGNISRDNSHEEEEEEEEEQAEREEGAGRSKSGLNGRGADLDEDKVGSKQEEDLSAYKQPPPLLAQHYSPSRDIEPIQEQSETARTDATTVVEYEDDYEQQSNPEDEEEDTARSATASTPPRPTPRKRQSFSASSGQGSPTSARSNPRSTTHSDGDNTNRSTGREATARSSEARSVRTMSATSSRHASDDENF